MNERMVCIPITGVLAAEGSALGANFAYTYAPCTLTVVEVNAAPSTDDSGLTIDINDDGSGVITGVGCADADTPGRWQSTHVGGDETPVTIAAGSKISLDANNAENGTVVYVQIWALTGEKFD